MLGIVALVSVNIFRFFFFFFFFFFHFKDNIENAFVFAPFRNGGLIFVSHFYKLKLYKLVHMMCSKKVDQTKFVPRKLTYAVFYWAGPGPYIPQRGIKLTPKTESTLTNF